MKRNVAFVLISLVSVPIFANCSLWLDQPPSLFQANVAEDVWFEGSGDADGFAVPYVRIRFASAAPFSIVLAEKRLEPEYFGPGWGSFWFGDWLTAPGPEGYAAAEAQAVDTLGGDVQYGFDVHGGHFINGGEGG